MPRLGFLGVLGTAALCLAAAAPAAAQNPVFKDFQRNGAINPCNYTPDQLNRARQQLPPDIQQYAPGLADQLNGACPRGPVAAPQQPTTQQLPAPLAPSGGAPPPPKPKVPAPPAPKPRALSKLASEPAPHISTAPVSKGVPGWLVVVLSVLGALGLAGALAARYGGWSGQRFTRPLRASFAEAGGRTADAFAELWERARLGR